MTGTRAPLPRFDAASAAHKVRLAEDGWNSRDPARVALAYTPDSVWRNRDIFLAGRDAIIDFLAAKWRRDGWVARSARNLACLGLYFLGVPPRVIARLYG